MKIRANASARGGQPEGPAGSRLSSPSHRSASSEEAPAQSSEGGGAGDRHGGLHVEGASVWFPGADSPALDDVDVVLPAGRVLAVLGPSGCGKSTLLRAVAGLQPLEAGRVSFGGTDVTRVPTHKRDFALMFQDGQLFGHLDVAGNVGYALARRGMRGAQRDERVAQLLDLVGLAGFERRSPATLSGGQQQRVALARALAARPRLLLLDEPLSALDRSLRERLAGDLRAILTAEGVTALFVTHDHHEALSVADDIAVMRTGRIVQHGPADVVWRAPADPEIAAFLGFTTSLSADDARALDLADGTWALRRSGLVVVGADAPGAMPARVVRVASSDEAQHVTIAIDALGGREVDTIAYPFAVQSDPLSDRSTLVQDKDRRQGARDVDVSLADARQVGQRVGVRVNPAGAVRFDA